MKFFEKKQIKKVDYRVKIWNLLVKKLKACKLFLIQRVVKKLRIEKKSNQEEMLANLKKLSSKDFQIFALSLMKERNIDFSKQETFFQKVLPDYSQKLAEMTQNHIEILKKIKNLTRFKGISEEIEKILEGVKKKIVKTKVSRKILKEKHRRKDKMKENFKNEENPIINNDKIKNLKNRSQKPFPPDQDPHSKKKQSSFPFKKQAKFPLKQQEFSPPKQNPVYPSPAFNSNEGNENRKNKDKFTNEKAEIHPSWQASLERREKERNQVFQGVKKKLI